VTDHEAGPSQPDPSIAIDTIGLYVNGEVSIDDIDVASLVTAALAQPDSSSSSAVPMQLDFEAMHRANMFIAFILSPCCKYKSSCLCCMHAPHICE
jgi:hypothetical protein